MFQPFRTTAGARVLLFGAGLLAAALLTGCSSSEGDIVFRDPPSDTRRTSARSGSRASQQQAKSRRSVQEAMKPVKQLIGLHGKKMFNLRLATAIYYHDHLAWPRRAEDLEPYGVAADDFFSLRFEPDGDAKVNIYFHEEKLGQGRLGVLRPTTPRTQGDPAAIDNRPGPDPP